MGNHQKKYSYERNNFFYEAELSMVVEQYNYLSAFAKLKNL